MIVIDRGIDLDTSEQVFLIVDFRNIRAAAVYGAQPVLEERRAVVVAVVIVGEEVAGQHETYVALIQVQFGGKLGAEDCGLESLGRGRLVSEKFLLLAAGDTQPRPFLVKGVEYLVTQPGIGDADGGQSCSLYPE